MKKQVRITFVAVIVALAVSWVALRQQNAERAARIAQGASSSPTTGDN